MDEQEYAQEFGRFSRADTRADPLGYYAELGLKPDCTKQEIQVRTRPPGVFPDLRMWQMDLFLIPFPFSHRVLNLRLPSRCMHAGCVPGPGHEVAPRQGACERAGGCSQEV
jgi:hypothetical protein